ncbi:PP2C family protein-serine/threonine phosphatase [Xanthobacter agilis]|uniref:PP2C family protein-serine/threonine phosphatase n=1 Tax=Xanthobacter agilis TaxID=47492 RepID=UPI00372A2930
MSDEAARDEAARDGAVSDATMGELRFAASAATRIGPRHRQNEDAHAAWDAAALFVVSDGIGGLADGAVASRAVVELLQRGVTPGAALDRRVAQARDALFRANAALFQSGAESGAPLGATVVLAVLGEGCAVCLWAGDSRAYLARTGRLHPITRDHAIFGRTAPGAAARTVITRAIGPEDDVEIDCAIVDLVAGDALLLCSDGVHGAIPSARLEQLVTTGPGVGATQVVEEAAACGTRDDATAIIVHIRAAEGAHGARA